MDFEFFMRCSRKAAAFYMISIIEPHDADQISSLFSEQKPTFLLIFASLPSDRTFGLIVG